MASPVRVRFAPSPTGYLHIGGLRTALYNWFMARKHGGSFLLRVEDTDRARLVEGAIENLYASLVACDVKPDEGIMVEHGRVESRGEFGPYLQSERREKHLAYAYELIEKGHAYYCFCTKERLEEVAKNQQLNKQPVMYDRHCRDLSVKDAENRAAVGDEHVIRLKVPLEGSIVMEDMIRGRVEIPWAQVDDQVLIKSDGYPTYHLAATCDDHDMRISHVIRGDEWLSSLPKHLYIFQIMGWEAPQYAHLPLLLNADKSKLSKRQGDVAVEDYLKKGYLPEALVNFVALLGWNPTADREVFTKEELAGLFDITKVNKGGAVFNIEKLDWLNGEYIKALPVDEYLLRLSRGGFMPEGVMQERAARIVKDRLVRLEEAPGLIDDAVAMAEYEAASLVWKKSTPEDAKVRLEGARGYVAAKSEAWFADVKMMEEETRAWIIEKGWGNGDTLWPLRVALSGREKSPSPFELMFVTGKDEALARIDKALAKMA
ncbi:glutamate--tRNA ligase [Patescibacteria group bacterium]|jgi:glutamyl-tRNA synthetase|nr:glutamate--tRNA ligase [Patescibacteria group bacterium]